MDKAEPSKRDIFDRMRAGEPIRLDDPQYYKVQEIVTRTLKLSVALNTSTDVEQIRDRVYRLAVDSAAGSTGFSGILGQPGARPDRFA